MESTYLLWLIFIPLFFSFVAFAGRWFGKFTQPFVEITHLLSVTLVLGFVLINVKDVLVSGFVLSLNDWFHVDDLGAIFLFIIGLVGFLAGVYSIGYTRHDLQTGSLNLPKISTYYGLFSLFLFTMILVVTSNNIIVMWAAVEATTLGSAFLVGVYGHHSSLEAAWKYVIICTVGVAFGLYGTILFYSDAVNVMQHPSNAALWTEIVKNAQLFDPALVKMAFVFILVGFGTKAGFFPMHAWLPDAYSEAPSPVSALLSAVLSNCALFTIIRFSIITNVGIGPEFTQTLFLIFGTLSLAAGVIFMFMQRDLVRLLAYSSMENIGLIVLAFGIGGPVGIFAGLLQALNTSMAKALLFCTSGNILIKYRSRDLTQIKGMLQVMPLTSFFLITGSLALIGSPPFSIFISKFFIITAGFGSGYLWLMILCLLLLTVSFTAILRAASSVVFGTKPEGMLKGEFNLLTLVPGIVLILFILVLGLYIPPQLTSLLDGATTTMLQGNPGAQVYSPGSWHALSDLVQVKASLLSLSGILP